MRFLGALLDMRERISFFGWSVSCFWLSDVFELRGELRLAELGKRVWVSPFSEVSRFRGTRQIGIRLLKC